MHNQSSPEVLRVIIYTLIVGGGEEGLDGMFYREKPLTRHRPKCGCEKGPSPCAQKDR